MIFFDFRRERARADQDFIGVFQNDSHRVPMSFAAADSDPMPVAALDGNDVRDIQNLTRLQSGKTRRIAVLRVQQIKRFGGVFAFDGFDDAANIGFKIAAVLLADQFETDHFHAVNFGRCAAAVNLFPRFIGAILRNERHLDTVLHQLAQQIRRVNAHSRNGWEEAARNKTNAHRILDFGFWILDFHQTLQHYF